MKKALQLLCVILPLSFCETGVAGGGGVAAVKITVAVSPRGAGTATLGPYVPETNVVVTAVVTNDCYYFKDWTVGGRVVETNYIYVFLAAKSETVTANFAAYTYEIQTAASPADGGSVSGGGTKTCGTEVTLTATPHSGFKFVNWTDTNEIAGTNAKLSFEASEAASITANFANIAPPKLTVTSPTTKVTTSDASETLTGTASDNIAVTGVYYELPGAEAVLAQMVKGWTNWSATVPLAFGTNAIDVYAVDSTGLTSAVRTVTVIRNYAPDITTFPIVGPAPIKSLQEHIAFDGANYMMVYQTIRDTENNNSDDVGQFVSPSGQLVGGVLDLNPDGSGDPPTVAFDGTNYLAGWVDYSDERAGVPVDGVFVSPAGAVGSKGQLTQSLTVDGFGTMVFGAGVYFLLWTDNRDSANNGGHDEIFGNIVSPAGGTNVVPDFEISANGQVSEGQVSGAFDGTNFLAVWSGAVGEANIHGQFISPTGAFVGDSFVIYTKSTVKSPGLSSVCFDGTKYLVLSTVESGSGSSLTLEIVGQFVTPSGEVLTNQLVVTSDKGPQIGAVGAFDPNASLYLITWNDGLNPFAAPPYSGKIQGRFFDSTGSPSSSEFTIFPSQSAKVPLLAPVLFEGTQFFSVAGFGKLVTAASKLAFTNSAIYGALISAP